MSCTVSGFAQIDAGTRITSSSQHREIVFYIGEDDALVLVFDQRSLAEFVELASTALRGAPEKDRVIAVA